MIEMSIAGFFPGASVVISTEGKVHHSAGFLRSCAGPSVLLTATIAIEASVFLQCHQQK